MPRVDTCQHDTCTVQGFTHLIFTNDELNNEIEKPCIGKCKDLRLTGDNSLQRCLPSSKWSVSEKQERTGLPIHIGITEHTGKRTGNHLDLVGCALFAIDVHMIPRNVHA